MALNSAKNQPRLEEPFRPGEWRTNTETAVPLPCCSEQLEASRNGLILLAPVRGTQQHGFSKKNKRELQKALVLQD
jgi:hypothetical protein